jgi:hypothetical protein
VRWFGWFRRKQAVKDNDVVDGFLPAVPDGRKRTLGVPYMMPTDLEEMNRLDFQHYMLRYAPHGNYAAPVGSPDSILDVGTGTGRWAREMAQLFPLANVVGVDVTLPPADSQAELGNEDVRPSNYAFVR